MNEIEEKKEKKVLIIQLPKETPLKDYSYYGGPDQITISPDRDSFSLERQTFKGISIQSYNQKTMELLKFVSEYYKNQAN